MTQLFANRYRLLGSLPDSEHRGSTSVGVDTDAAGEAKLVIIEQISNDDRVVSEISALIERCRQLGDDKLTSVEGIEQLDSGAFVVRRLVPGESLGSLMRGFAAANTAIPPALDVDLIAETARILGHTHRMGPSRGRPPLVHDGLTPESPLLGLDGVVRIGDFPTSAARLKELSRQARVPAASLRYFTPEQWNGEWGRPQNDVFRLGILLWESLCGQGPFGHSDDFSLTEQVRQGTVPPLADFTPDVPELLDRFVHKSLSESADQRFEDAAEFTRVLDRLRNRAPLDASPDRNEVWLRYFPARFRKWKELLSSVESGHLDEASAQLTQLLSTPSLRSSDTDDGELTAVSHVDADELLAGAPPDDADITVRRTVTPQDIETEPQRESLDAGADVPGDDDTTVQIDENALSQNDDAGHPPVSSEARETAKMSPESGPQLERREGFDDAFAVDDSLAVGDIPDLDATVDFGDTTASDGERAPVIQDSSPHADSDADPVAFQPTAELDNPARSQKAAQQNDPEEDETDSTNEVDRAHEELSVDPPADDIPSDQTDGEFTNGHSPQQPLHQQQPHDDEPGPRDSGNAQLDNGHQDVGEPGLDRRDQKPVNGQLGAQQVFSLRDDEDELDDIKLPVDLDTLVADRNTNHKTRREDEHAPKPVVEILITSTENVLESVVLRGGLFNRKYTPAEGGFQIKRKKDCAVVAFDDEVPEGELQRSRDDRPRPLTGDDGELKLRVGDIAQIRNGGICFHVRFFFPPNPPASETRTDFKSKSTRASTAFGLAVLLHVVIFGGLMTLSTTLGVSLVVEEEPQREEEFAEGELAEIDEPEEEEPDEPEPPEPEPEPEPPEPPADPTEQQVELPEEIQQEIDDYRDDEPADDPADDLIGSLDPGETDDISAIDEEITNIDAFDAEGHAGDMQVGGELGALDDDEGPQIAERGSGLEEIADDESQAGQLAQRERDEEVRGRVDSVDALTQVQGTLAREEIERVIARHQGQIQGCYESALTSNPSLGGQVTFEWVVTADGSVSNAREQQSTLGSAEVSNCILGIIRGMNFPSPEGGSSVEISYPFAFQAVH